VAADKSLAVIGIDIGNADFDVDNMIVHVPSGGHTNLTAQRGVFTVIRSNFGDRDEYPCSLDEVIPEKKDTCIRKLSLSVRESGGVLHILRRLGVDAGSLFPGFGGAARATYEAMQVKITKEQDPTALPDWHNRPIAEYDPRLPRRKTGVRYLDTRDD
jgi:hypothetical protein